MWLTPHQFRNNKDYVFSKARENGIKKIITIEPDDGDGNQPKKVYDVETKEIIKSFNMKTWEKFEHKDNGVYNPIHPVQPKKKYKYKRVVTNFPYFTDPSTAFELENHTRLPGRRTRRRRTTRRPRRRRTRGR
jgi:hypothetical protein